ncbi:MAG TPA: Ig-like domain-containing protein [Terriglobales bacterium]|nr:Ig-like domain-containing protein [Terriglobales bacterium]
MTRSHRTRHVVLGALLLAIAILSACGGKNGLVGGGQGDSVFLKSIDLSPVNPTLAFSKSPAASRQFTVIGHYNIGNPKDITSQMTWISLDPKVATIDATGNASAVGSGRVIIQAQIFVPASQQTLQASTVLTVVPQLTAITITPSSAQIARATSQQFTASGTFNDGTNADITALVSWNSSQSASATVSSSPGTQGRALGVSAGTTSITANLGSLASAPAPLKVTNANLVSLAVGPAGSTVPLASSQQFVATGAFDDGTTQDIAATANWNSSSPAVARVTSVGVVTGFGIGDADITASVGPVSNTATASVDASSVSKITIVPVAKIASNTSAQMRAVAVFSDGSSRDVTNTPGIAWSSSNSAVATVNAASGLASGQGPGSSNISAKLGSSSGSTALAVSDATIQSLAVAPDQSTIAPSTTQNVIALATFTDSSGHFQQDVSQVAVWSSDNTGVATVAFAKGLQELATGVATGTANLTASFSDAHGNLLSSSAALNVSGATLTGVSIAPGSVDVMFGGGQQFIATGNLSDGTQQDLTLTAGWNSADPAVADVSPMGFASASGPGQTSIAATLSGVTGSGSLLVNPGALVKIDICAASTADPLNNCPPLDPISTPPPISFAKQIPYGVIAIGTFTDGSRQDLTNSVRWTSSDVSIAIVSNDPGIPGIATGVPRQGSVTGFVSGRVTVTATAGGISGNMDVFVTDATPVLINITPFNGTVPHGLNQQLTAVVMFTDNTTETVTAYVHWTTSNPAIVVVAPGGLAYSTGSGVATVTAIIGGTSGSATLTVQ